jgi:hypothetical protein
MYLSPQLVTQLRPRLLAGLKPGARIISHDFRIDDWTPDAQVTVAVPDKPYGAPQSEVFLWIVPADAAGVWRWRADAGTAPVDFELSIAQNFQRLSGRGTAGGEPARIASGRMQGADIRFSLEAAPGGRQEKQEYRGRLEGDRISGTIAVAGVERAWQATRVRRGAAAPGGG